MSETPSPPKDSKSQESRYTIWFMAILSFICALILSVLASALAEPQDVAKELDRSAQMLRSARIISPYGYFQVQDSEGNYIPAKATEKGILVPADKKISAGSTQILDVYRVRIKPVLVNDKGEETTFEKAGINEAQYLNDYRKTGYYKEPWKLIYKIYSQTSEGKEPHLEGFVIPVNGMGLWDYIYGYIALKPDGNSVIGISWYDQKETPGLGGNIAEASWQDLFHGKQVFQKSPDGKTDLKTAPVGIIVVKGKVSEVLGDSPKSYSSVDGMAGSTLTGNGVTDAYKNTLSAYRPYLIKVNEEGGKNEPAKTPSK